jgi:hypothetical protein
MQRENKSTSGVTGPAAPLVPGIALAANGGRRFACLEQTRVSQLSV